LVAQLRGFLKICFYITPIHRCIGAPIVNNRVDNASELFGVTGWTVCYTLAMGSVVVKVLRVFVDERGKFGNPVGIVMDEKQRIPPLVRQSVAIEIGFSESVFINNINEGNLSIFNPKREVNFAGHALVGTAHCISKLSGTTIKSLRCKSGQVKTWKENDQTWIRADLQDTPPWKHKEHTTPASVEEITTAQAKNMNHTMVWAWADKKKDIVRARTFAPDWGIPEDEANGSGSMQLVSKLNRELEIHHGKGSVIYTRPAENGFAEVGGRVVEDQPRKIETLQDYLE